MYRNVCSVMEILFKIVTQVGRDIAWNWYILVRDIMWWSRRCCVYTKTKPTSGHPPSEKKRAWATFGMTSGKFWRLAFPFLHSNGTALVPKSVSSRHSSQAYQYDVYCWAKDSTVDNNGFSRVNYVTWAVGRYLIIIDILRSHIQGRTLRTFEWHASHPEYQKAQSCR